MPVLSAGEAEGVSAAAGDGRRLHVRHLDGVAAVRGRAPAQQPIALINTSYHTNNHIQELKYNKLAFARDFSRGI